MAEAASNTPTFKLVLVGDGGTGKVSYYRVMRCHGSGFLELIAFIPTVVAHTISDRNANISPDYVRQASFNWRVREEVHRNSWC